MLCPFDNETVCDGICSIDDVATGMSVWVCPHLPEGGA